MSVLKKESLTKFTKDFTTSLDNLTFEQKKFLVDLLVENIEVTTVSSQLNLNIKLRFDQSKVERNEAGYEPKTPTTKPKDDSNGGEISEYGQIRPKGYFHLSIYHKMRKRQYGSRWQTQFVPLCREEVKRLEERRMQDSLGIEKKPALEYMEDVEMMLGDINRSDRVTL